MGIFKKKRDSWGSGAALVLALAGGVLFFREGAGRLTALAARLPVSAFLSQGETSGLLERAGGVYALSAYLLENEALEVSLDPSYESFLQEAALSETEASPASDEETGESPEETAKEAPAMAATEVVGTLYSEEQLADVFYLYGELKNARRLAAAVVAYRTGKKPILTSGDLLEIVTPFIGRDKEKKFLAQVFQALRIEVNDEMRALREMLGASLKVLRPGGRLVVITYHSLEDRLVKNFLKTGNFEGKVEQDFFGNVRSPFKLLSGKVITPSKEEIERNPRSRSAKLRIAEKRQEE